MRILIIKLGALGDVVMATPLIAAIERAHARAALHLLTTPAFAPIFAAWQGLETTAFPRHGMRALVAALCWVRRQGFDRVYDLQGNDRSGLLCALSGIGERVGNHPRFPYTHHPAEKWTGQCHIFERMNAVLESAGVARAAPAPLLPSTAAERAQVRAWIERHGLQPQGFALLHAGASPRWPTKVWPYFAALAARIEQAGVRVVWVGAAPEAALNRELAAHAGVDATAEFSVPGLAELGRAARFAVTNDSGPMHIVSCSGIPVFALFGPTNWRRNHAIGQAHRVLACVDYAPALAVHAGADCLARIPCDAVWQRLRAAGLL